MMLIPAFSPLCKYETTKKKLDSDSGLRLAYFLRASMGIKKTLTPAGLRSFFLVLAFNRSA